MHLAAANLRLCLVALPIIVILVSGSCTPRPIYLYSDPIALMPPAKPSGANPWPTSPGDAFGTHVDQAESLLHRHPNDPMVLNDVGIIRAASGDVASGAALLDKAHEMDPGAAIIAYNDALLDFQQRKVRESINLLQEALRRNPELNEGRVALAAVEIEQKEYNDAAAIISKLSQDQAGTVYAEIALGAIQLWKHNVDEAIWSFQRAIQLDPNNAVAQFDLGCAYLAQNDVAQAEQSFQVALDKDPQLAAAHNNLGTLFARSGNPAGAVSEYRKAAELSPSSSLFVGNLSNAAGRMYSTPGTGRNVEFTSVTTNSDNPENRSQMGSSAAHPSDGADAEATLRAIDRILTGPHETMPPAESRRSFDGGTSIHIDNGTSYEVHVYLAGPINRNVRVAPRGGSTISVTPGRYLVAADVRDSGILPCYGVQNYAVGLQYTERLVVGNAR